MRSKFKKVMGGLVGAAMLATSAQALAVTFKDPTGDDNGPGTYTYPTDAAYLKGAFDLTEFKAEKSGGDVEFSASVAASLNDPWGMGNGFATQMVFIFINTGAGKYKDGAPGLNVKFAPGWDKLVVLSPQKKARVESEVKNNAAAMAADILVPTRTKGSGKTISGSVKAADLGAGDPETWSYQVVVQSNEGFPAKGDLLTRRVNEFEGQHRFGGGNDGLCDPHAMDILAGAGAGGADEATAQHTILKAFECGPEGESVKTAVLPMLKK
jgi:carbohydrate-binding DOMON domain-containing protein